LAAQIHRDVPRTHNVLAAAARQHLGAAQMKRSRHDILHFRYRNDPLQDAHRSFPNLKPVTALAAAVFLRWLAVIRLLLAFIRE
jgi:hypothetical protein